MTCLRFWDTKTKYTQQKPSCVMHKNTLTVVLANGASFASLGDPDVRNANSAAFA